MQTILEIIPYIQIILSVLLITSIVLQQSGASVGGAMGGGDTGSFYSTRRGFEKFLFYFGIVCGVLLIIFTLLPVVFTPETNFENTENTQELNVSPEINLETETNQEDTNL